MLGAWRRVLKNLTLLLHWSGIQPRLVAQGIFLTAVMSGLCQCWLRSLSSDHWWLLIPWTTHSLCTCHKAVNKCYKLVYFDLSAWVLPMKGRTFVYPWIIAALATLSVYCFVVWFVSSTYYKKSPATHCFLWLPGWGKLYSLPVVHLVKSLRVYRNEIAVSMTLALGECRIDMCLWVFRKLPSLC